MKFIKIIYYFAILLFLFLWISCDKTPSNASGIAEMATPVYLARISENSIITSADLLTGDGWALERAFPDTNFNIIQGNINYRITFVNAVEAGLADLLFHSDNKWIPYTFSDIQPRMGPFHIIFSGFNDDIDIGLENFLDPFDNNTLSALQFYAVFPDALSSRVIQSIRSTKLVAIYNNSDDESQLQFRFETTEGVEYATALFMLEMDAEDIPGGNYGDDYVLNFKFLSGNNELTVFAPGQNVDDVPDFFCVYDKRLMDNAYTFIDERVDMFGDATGEEDRNSEQLAISGFTWHCRDANTDTNTNIFGRVAYNFSGQDAPAEFNDKMSQQQTCIQWFHWYAQQQGFPVNAGDYYPDWPDTLAPYAIKSPVFAF